MSSMKMAANPVPAQPAEDLRRTFETAIAQIRQSGAPLRRSQTPIFVRKLTAMPNRSDTEQRALTAAARALAQLWNVSPNLIR
jgi:hypothetical protein